MAKKQALLILEKANYKLLDYTANEKTIIYYSGSFIHHIYFRAEMISRVDVVGNRRMDGESVRLLADVKTGQDLNSEGVNQAVKRLQQSGYFSSVRAQMDNGILKINVSESPTIDKVTIEGNDDISTDDLRKELRLKERGTFDESLIGADVQRILMVYQRKGFFSEHV